MKTMRIVAVTLVVAALVISAAAAQEIEQNNGYIVTPAGDTDKFGGILPLSTYYTITQGETDRYSTYVSFGTNDLDVDLNWGSVQNSLALTIIAPDATLGPYYDADDGQTDGRIHLLITKPGGLASGTWNSRVYGYNVQGTEDYTYSWN